MTLAQEMFAIAPAYGRATVSASQAELLTGKAIWLQRLHARNFPVVPSIVLTRAAWDGLQAERRRGDVRLRAHWIATLFRLVPRDGQSPVLVVRTSAAQHQPGLMPARTSLVEGWLVGWTRTVAERSFRISNNGSNSGSPGYRPS